MLQRYQNQVGGHCRLVKLQDSSKLYKPWNENEHRFYERLRSLGASSTEFVPLEILRRFVPKYHGTVEIELEVDTDSRGEGTYQSGLREPPTPPPSICSPPSETADTASGRATPIPSPTPTPPPAHAVPRRRGVTYLILQDLVHDFKKACILDIKMGKRQRKRDASPRKERRQLEKAMKTTSHSLGFRFCGFRFYDEKNDYMHYRDKYWGRQLTSGKIQSALKCFFWNGWRFQLELVQPLIGKLTALRNCIRGLKHWRFWSSSLLIVYDGGESNQEKKVKSLDVKMIDFANTTTLLENPSPDEEYLFGLDNLIQALQTIFEESQPEDKRREHRAEQKTVRHSQSVCTSLGGPAQQHVNTLVPSGSKSSRHIKAKVSEDDLASSTGHPSSATRDTPSSTMRSVMGSAWPSPAPSPLPSQQTSKEGVVSSVRMGGGHYRGPTDRGHRGLEIEILEEEGEREGEAEMGEEGQEEQGEGEAGAEAAGRAEEAGGFIRRSVSAPSLLLISRSRHIAGREPMWTSIYAAVHTSNDVYTLRCQPTSAVGDGDIAFMANTHTRHFEEVHSLNLGELLPDWRVQEGDGPFALPMSSHDAASAAARGKGAAAGAAGGVSLHPFVRQSRMHPGMSSFPRSPCLQYQLPTSPFSLTPRPPPQCETAVFDPSHHHLRNLAVWKSHHTVHPFTAAEPSRGIPEFPSAEASPADGSAVDRRAYPDRRGRSTSNGHPPLGRFCSATNLPSSPRSPLDPPDTMLPSVPPVSEPGSLLMDRSGSAVSEQSIVQPSTGRHSMPPPSLSLSSGDEAGEAATEKNGELDRSIEAQLEPSRGYSDQPVCGLSIEGPSSCGDPLRQLLGAAPGREGVEQKG